MVYLLLVGWSGGVEEGWRIGGGREKRRAGEELENRRRAGEEEGWRRGGLEKRRREGTRLVGGGTWNVM